MAIKLQCKIESGDSILLNNVMNVAEIDLVEMECFDSDDIGASVWIDQNQAIEIIQHLKQQFNLTGH